VLTHEKLLAENKVQKEKILELENQLSELRRLIFGSRSEKFKPTTQDPNQGNLFADQELENPEEVVQATEEITYTRKKNQNHKGRKALPEHLPVREVIIEPQEDTSEMEKIGEVVTETLEYTPGSLVRLRRIRPKYVKKANSKKEEDTEIVIATMPPRPIPKCLAEPSLLSHMIVSKFIDHLPFYRQIKMFKRDFKWEPSKSTVNDWFVATCTLLEPLYEKQMQKVLMATYIQADESPLKVQSGETKGKTHQGYQWVYHAPDEGIVLFHYHKNRSVQAPRELLKEYKGWVQCDGYAGYDKLARIYGDIQLAGCWVHARRGFDKAKNSDNERATYALNLFSKIYMHEKECKNYNAEKRKEYRNQHTLPLVNELKNWIDEESIKVLPKSPLGKAMTYCVNQWAKLIRVFDDGRLEMDNNLIENKIRPLALGRKNYLFAGSHPAAQRIAMMYSFFATCSIHSVNPRDWLSHAIENISDTKMSDLDQLLPSNFQKG